MPRLDAIPFESQYQYMATLHSNAAGGENIIYLKGFPILGDATLGNIANTFNGKRLLTGPNLLYSHFIAGQRTCFI
jgi:hypothetical protein